MKSLSERLVAKLKSWRLRNNDTEVEDAVSVEHAVNEDPTSPGKDNKRDQPIEPASESIDAIATKPVSPKKSDDSFDVPPNVESVVASKSKAKSGARKLLNDDTAVRQVLANSDETSAQNTTEELDVSRENTHAALAVGDDEAVLRAVNKQESSQTPETKSKKQAVKQRTTKNVVAPPALASTQKPSRLPKQNVADALVTDQELDALEAENKRLKLLLSEKLKGSNEG
ncbi:hypothetical protein [Ochrobactrum sp. EDr1-4]|uniref:hypothetical protein n=1 Tax=Ochrobactrum sp. EDr1-4 TaxID=3368622 RepID=UPI003BA0581C